MSELIKMSGRLLTFDKVDKCGILFSKDCKITYPETLPVLWNFRRSNLDEVLGNATVSIDDSGLICDAVLYNNDIINLLPEFNDELPIGGFFNKLKDRRVGSVRIIEECNLAGVSVVLAPASDDYKMSLVKESED